MPPLFRRSAEPNDTEPQDTPESAEADEEASRPRGYTPGKGRPTPKRSEAQRRAAEPPPADRREAAKRLRDRQRKERAEARQKMMDGDQKFLPPRDRGEERALVRDIVDARRNVGSYFLIAALVILIGTSGAMPPVIKLGAEVLWYLLALSFIVDCVLLTLRVRKKVRERFPKTKERTPALALYAIMRSISFRKLRMPKPRYKVGQKI